MNPNIVRLGPMKKIGFLSLGH
jgi:alkanesulfonate monooxygenase SsuD/methylene tetrahydromethanopterin reductase-like flavin-dependent oxidoreductase (luciferase family)